MPASAVLDLDQDEARAAESALGRVLETAVRVTGAAPPNQETRSLLLQVVTEQTQAVLPLVLDSTRRARRRWEYLRSLGWAGHAADVQAAREPFLESVEGKLRLIGAVRRMAEAFVLLTGQTLPEATALQEAEEELKRFKSEVFGRWQTLEDLEDMLAESFPLSDETLEAVGKNHPAPPAWYEQEGKPF